MTMPDPSGLERYPASLRLAARALWGIADGSTAAVPPHAAPHDPRRPDGRGR